MTVTSDWEESFRSQMDGTVETIRAYAEQIESGRYGDTWTVTRHADDGTETMQWETAVGNSSVDAVESVTGTDSAAGDYQAELNSADEPTVDDTPISEYPLEVVDERGREFAVVLSTGGPHIEVVADGLSSARLEGYWGGSRLTRSGDYLSTFLDYFIERD